jgi:hypothetical protein
MQMLQVLLQEFALFWQQYGAELMWWIRLGFSLCLFWEGLGWFRAIKKIRPAERVDPGESGLQGTEAKFFPTHWILPVIYFLVAWSFIVLAYMILPFDFFYFPW